MKTLPRVELQSTQQPRPPCKIPVHPESAGAGWAVSGPTHFLGVQLQQLRVVAGLASDYTESPSVGPDWPRFPP